MELTLEIIEMHKPKSIMDIIDPRIFGNEINEEPHSYIKSGICYEYYYAISKALQPQTIFEIGNRYGYSGISLLKGSPKARFMGWDLEAGTWGGQKNSRNRAIINFRNSGFSVPNQKIDPLDPPAQVFLYRVNSQQQQSIDLGVCFDLIHIDGDHSYEGTYHDLHIASYACRQLIIDDYSFDTPPNLVKQAIDNFIKNNQNRIEQVLHIPTFRKMVYIKFKQ